MSTMKQRVAIFMNASVHVPGADKDASNKHRKMKEITRIVMAGHFSFGSVARTKWLRLGVLFISAVNGLKHAHTGRAEEILLLTL